MINCSHESLIFLTVYNLGLLLCILKVYLLPLTEREVNYFKSTTFITQFLTIIIHDQLFIWIIDFSHHSQFGIVNYIFWRYIPFLPPRSALECTITFPRYGSMVHYNCGKIQFKKKNLWKNCNAKTRGPWWVAVSLSVTYKIQ